MADEKTYIIRLVAWAGRAIGETRPLFTNFHSDQLGMSLPAAVRTAGPVVAALQQADVTAGNVLAAANDLEMVASSEEELEILAAIVRFGAALIAFYVALDELVEAIDDAITPATVPDDPAGAHAFAGELARRISDYALASGITEFIPEFAFLLRVAGLLDWRYVPPPETGSPLSRGHVRKSLALQRIKDLISDPEMHFQQTIGWGDPNFDPIDIFRLVEGFFHDEVDVEAGRDMADDPFLRFGSFRLSRDSATMPPGLLLALRGDLGADYNTRVSISEGWGFGIGSNLRLVGMLSGSITPPFIITLHSPMAEVSGLLRAFFDRNADARPFDIVGGTGLLTVSAENLTAGAALRAVWDVDASTVTFSPMIFAGIDGLTLKIGTSNADSFIGTLLSSAMIEGELDLGLEWEPATGLRVMASGGVEIAIPLHRRLGPIEIQTIYISLRIGSDGTLSLEISTAISAVLGPLTAVADRMGAQLDVRFAEDPDARFGPVDLDLKFKPPNGVGLAVDAGVVKGGGFLFFDFERGEYGGAIQLTFSGFLSLAAIGLINTKNPDGSPGFSMIIIITAEFGTGIQLGFGFTLLGVGGILGLNRSVNTPALLEGVRSGAISHILFPRDVVANAPRILSDIRMIFPPQQGIFLVGPVAKFGWGTPTLISITFGLVIQIPPGNIYILGVLSVLLPTEETAILSLRVLFVGGIEFDKKRIFFFAGLFDSRILTITIEGEMGLLIAWGDDANFVVSVGGFHPSFQPPPLPIPIPRRIALSLINTSVARVRVEGYFAVTSNTVQFGARVDIFFGFDAFNVQGFIAFDALFQFSPFYFIITISASFSLNVFGLSLLSVRIRGSLEGPTPWRAAGEGSISLLFFEISADFEVIWGEERDTTLPPIEVLPLLRAEFEKKENWQAVLPPANSLLVSLRRLPEDETLVLHPVGVLRASQRAIPLDLTLDKVGNQAPSDVNRLSVDAAGALTRRAHTIEQFAPAQFQNFSDADKLSRPAYGPEHGGLEMAGTGEDTRTSRCVQRVSRYEEIILDTNLMRAARSFFEYAGTLFHFFAARGTVATSELSKMRKTQLQPFDDRIAVASETYTVALQSNNRAYDRAPESFGSEADAHDFMQREMARNPRLAGTLHVIPTFERAA